MTDFLQMRTDITAALGTVRGADTSKETGPEEQRAGDRFATSYRRRIDGFEAAAVCVDVKR
jgi:hypothetical protein